jgi:hypothetical protein
VPRLIVLFDKRVDVTGGSKGDSGSHSFPPRPDILAQSIAAMHRENRADDSHPGETTD